MILFPVCGVIAFLLGYFLCLSGRYKSISVVLLGCAFSKGEVKDYIKSGVWDDKIWVKQHKKVLDRDKFINLFYQRFREDYYVLTFEQLLQKHCKRYKNAVLSIIGL